MAQRFASFFPQRINMHFANAAIGSYGAGQSPHIATFNLGTPYALDADALLAAESIASSGTTTTFAAAYVATEAQMGRWGRNITVVASGTASSVVRVVGRNYLGQLMRENFTLNNASIVQGVKAFRYVDKIGWDATSGTTINVGLGNYLGIPYRSIAMVHEIKNNAVAANAGTFVAGLATTSNSTYISTDPRGLYLPVTVIPNASVSFVIRCVVDPTQLYGVPDAYAAI